ncbi:hypothetical protein B0J17DRAFT_721079 [Rhizoctonia solani]|nr:hypothetical protein B0J17DRAFT_721079 [Rhizoctonia solani]
MPRLTTLLTTIVALSTSLVPVLSLDSGVYRIRSLAFGGSPLFMHMDGPGSDIQIQPPVGDPRQLWRVIQVNERGSTIQNVAFNCRVSRGVASNDLPAPVCHDDADPVNLTPVPGGASNDFYIDFPQDNERCISDFSRNVYVSPRQNPANFPLAGFTFELVRRA